MQKANKALRAYPCALKDHRPGDNGYNQQQLWNIYKLKLQISCFAEIAAGSTLTALYELEDDT